MIHAHPVPMEDQGRRLTGQELEMFFRRHGGLENFKRHKEASKPHGSRIDTWEDENWRLRIEKSLPANEIAVYEHKGNIPPDA